MTNWLIKHGQVLDGSGSAAQPRDIRIANGIIVELGPHLANRGETELDAAGLMVAPGLVDLHTHPFPGMGQFGVSPDDIGLRTGVTTMLDTGTAGALTYPAFEQLVIDHAGEDIFALLNISIVGCLQGNPAVPPYMGELSDARYVHVPSAVACFSRFKARGRLIGFKVRLTKALANNASENEHLGLRSVIEAATQSGTFLMIHHIASAIPSEEVLGLMRANDVLTHVYHPHSSSPFRGADKKPSDALRRARQRGVLFDVGHGMGAFGWEVAEAACQQHGFWPDTISTDAHAFNLAGPVFDLTTTMSKFLHLGMPLSEIIHATTQRPATAMGLGKRFGLLAAGRQADIVLLKIEAGQFALNDVLGQTRLARQRIVPVGVLKKGEFSRCQPRQTPGAVNPPVLETAPGSV